MYFLFRVIGVFRGRVLSIEHSSDTEAQHEQSRTTKYTNHTKDEIVFLVRKCLIDLLSVDLVEGFHAWIVSEHVLR